MPSEERIGELLPVARVWAPQYHRIAIKLVAAGRPRPGPWWSRRPGRMEARMMDAAELGAFILDGAAEPPPGSGSTRSSRSTIATHRLSRAHPHHHDMIKLIFQIGTAAVITAIAIRETIQLARHCGDPALRVLVPGLWALAWASTVGFANPIEDAVPAAVGLRAWPILLDGAVVVTGFGFAEFFVQASDQPAMQRHRILRRELALLVAVLAVSLAAVSQVTTLHIGSAKQYRHQVPLLVYRLATDSGVVIFWALGVWRGARFATHVRQRWLLGTGPWAVQQALIFRQWTDDIVLFVHHAPDPSTDDHAKLAARGIEVILDPVVGLEATDGHLSGIQLTSGCVVARRALAVMPRATPRTGPLADLGIEITEHPLGLGLHIPADPTGATSVPGLRVASNLIEPGGWISQAVSTGAMAAAALNMELIDEDTERTLQTQREPTSDDLDRRETVPHPARPLAASRRRRA